MPPAKSRKGEFIRDPKGGVFVETDLTTGRLAQTTVVRASRGSLLSGLYAPSKEHRVREELHAYNVARRPDRLLVSSDDLDPSTGLREETAEKYGISGLITR